MANQHRTFAKPFVVILDGETTRFAPGDTIDTDVAEALHLGDHLFEDGDNGLTEKIAATVAAQRNKTSGRSTTSTELGDMTVAQLKSYAADNGLDVGDATKKADLLTAIADAEKAKAEQADAEAKAAADAANGQNAQ